MLKSNDECELLMGNFFWYTDLAREIIPDNSQKRSPAGVQPSPGGMFCAAMLVETWRIPAQPRQAAD